MTTLGTGTDVLIDHLSRLFDARVAVCHDNYGDRVGQQTSTGRWWVEVDGKQITAVGDDSGARSVRDALRMAFTVAVDKLFDKLDAPPDELSD